MYSTSDYINIYLLDIQRNWTKNAIETWIAWNEVNGLYPFHLQTICAKYDTYKLYVKRIYTI
jgi:hypothetical protein